MKKKALIVGISNYGDRLPRLDSPLREIEEWRDLLMEEYGFHPENIRLLANDRARREEIEFRLNWLFDGAEKDDQLVFIFAGHGAHLRKRDRKTAEILDGQDEALVAYPSTAKDDLEQMAFFDDDLLALYDRLVPAEAKGTFILDCCYGGGFNGSDLPRHPRAMSVDVPVDLRHRSLKPKNDGKHRKRSMPVILTAASELNLSVEVDLPEGRRSLFGYHAIKELRGAPSISYRNLLHKISPTIEEYYPQRPDLNGNASRHNRSFLQ